MTAYRAAWVCPIDQPPIADGVVVVESGRIVSVLAPGTRHLALNVQDLGNAAL